MFSFLKKKLYNLVSSSENSSEKKVIKSFANDFLTDIKDELKEIEKTLTKKKTKDPNAPKRAKNAYIIFSSQKRSEIHSEEPDLSPTQVTVKIAKLWKELSDIEKSYYEELSLSDKERYLSEVTSYKEEKEDKEDKEEVSKSKVKKDHKAPKNPRSAYNIFCSEKRQEVKEDNPDFNSSQIMKHLGMLWKDMDDNDKKEYTNLAEEDKKRYEYEMDQYTAGGNYK